jgi:hypothetical protein
MKQILLRRLAALEQKFGKFAATQGEVWALLHWTFPYYARGLKPVSSSETPFTKLLDYESQQYELAVAAGDKLVLESWFMEAWKRLFTEANQDLDRMIATSPSLAVQLVLRNIPDNWEIQLIADVEAHNRQISAAKTARGATR